MALSAFDAVGIASVAPGSNTAPAASQIRGKRLFVFESVFLMTRPLPARTQAARPERRTATGRSGITTTRSPCGNALSTCAARTEGSAES